jgi:hypothetical protein
VADTLAAGKTGLAASADADAALVEVWLQKGGPNQEASKDDNCESQGHFCVRLQMAHQKLLSTGARRGWG